MNVVIFALSYIEWHYTRGVRDLIQILRNIFVFVVNFFSIPTLTSSLFAPWRRLGEARQHNYLDLEEIASVFIVNTLMRIVGFGIRLVTISLGFVAILIFLLIAVVALVMWLAWPLIIVILLVNGIYLLVR